MIHQVELKNYLEEWPTLKNNEEYRLVIMTHLEYISKEVGSINRKLKEMNGRVHRNEKSISKLFTIGTTLSFVFTLILSYLGIKK